MSRQTRYQDKHFAAGLCRQCPELAVDGTFCAECREKQRKSRRDLYRKHHGIPLAAPLSHGRPRIY